MKLVCLLYETDEYGSKDSVENRGIFEDIEKAKKAIEEEYEDEKLELDYEANEKIIYKNKDGNLKIVIEKFRLDYLY